MRLLALFLILGNSIYYLQAQDFYNITTIPDIKIYFKESNWNEMLDSFKRAESEGRLIGDAVIGGKKYEKVGVRYKGNSSFKNVSDDGHSKLPFNIKINEVNKKQALASGQNTLKLSNNFRDPSFIREVLAYEIARKYLPAPRANFAKLYVNDQYLGVYTNDESIDDAFLRLHFKEDKGALVKCDPEWSVEQAPNCPDSDKSSLSYIGEDSTCYMRFYELKDKNGWKNFINFTKVLNQQPDQIESQLDINQTLWMLAFNNVLLNLDSYTGLLCHNFYLYRDTLGVYHPLIWDLNMAFGGFRRLRGTKELTTEEMQQLSPFVHFNDEDPKHPRPLISKLLKNDLYRKMYLAHLQTILNENFTNGWYLKRAQELQKIIDASVKADSQKLYGYEAFQQNLLQTVQADDASIVGIVELMSKRAEFLAKHPLFQKEAPKISNIVPKQVSNVLNITAKVENTQKTWLFYRYGAGNFNKMEMLPAADGTFSAAIDFNKNAQYYLVAEGERLATFSPARAAQEFYKLETPIVKPVSAKPKPKGK